MNHKFQHFSSPINFPLYDSNFQVHSWDAILKLPSTSSPQPPPLTITFLHLVHQIHLRHTPPTGSTLLVPSSSAVTSSFQSLSHRRLEVWHRWTAASVHSETKADDNDWCGETCIRHKQGLYNQLRDVLQCVAQHIR